jgi:hypothetical protein
MIECLTIPVSKKIEEYILWNREYLMADQCRYAIKIEKIIEF